MMKQILLVFLCSWCMGIFAAENPFIKLTAAEEQKLVEIGRDAVTTVSRRLVKTISTDIKAVGVAEAARSWSKSVNIINGIADSYNLGMKIRRPTYQYRNPLNKPDALDRIALDFFQSDASEDAQYFSGKIMGDKGTSYLYYQPMYVSQKCLLCHSTEMAEDVKAVINEKYPGDLSGDLKLGAFRAVIRVELPESAIK